MNSLVLSQRNFLEMNKEQAYEFLDQWYDERIRKEENSELFSYNNYKKEIGKIHTRYNKQIEKNEQQLKNKDKIIFKLIEEQKEERGVERKAEREERQKERENQERE
ncbi:21224_t:CDS:2, partial [Cetraspora pellucida]